MCEHKQDFKHQKLIKMPKKLGGKSISADSCFIPFLKELWKNNIYTHSHCCGHGKLAPSIVVDSSLKFKEVPKIREIAKNNGFNYLKIYQWQLINIANRS